MPGREGDHYESHPEKRFHISHDEISRERIQLLKELHEKLREEIPDITIGFTLFGSLSKGRELTVETAPSADIDMAIFIDIDDIQKKIGDLEEKNPNSKFAQFVPPPAQWTWDDLKEEMRSREFCKVRAYIGRRLVEIAVERQDPHDKPDQKKLQLFVYPIAQEGSSSIFNVVKDYYAAIQEKRDADILVSQERVARFFHLDVGGSMRKYRRDFLQKLANMPDHEQAKELWDVTVYAMKVQERFKWEELSEQLKRAFPSQDLNEELQKQKISRQTK